MPPIMDGINSRENSGERKTQGKRGIAQIEWSFESKDLSEELYQKFGNFNTPIIMKMCSKYNKDKQEKADPVAIAELVVTNLNQDLEAQTLLQYNVSSSMVGVKWPLVVAEVMNFTARDGFINVFLSSHGS